ncbi:6-bladed beta-propeller [Membranihabitans maritimus]|uniref:6-bladed beta-propeller n=1 Tax=Membranihabitans maritimus TaxID=2904244 RepID=UPI002103B193|nr:6-bladed beta-propeller [Membranihabitans maritimus]
MKYSLVLFSLVVLNTISCNQENIVNGQINSQEPKMIHMPLNKALPYTEINFSNVKIIPLESNDNYMLGDIAKVYFRNNRFFVRPHNGDIIFIFDRTGKGLGRLDATGDGPGGIWAYG